MYSRSGSTEFSSGSSSSGSGRVYNIGGSSGSEPGSTSWGDSSGSGSRSDSSGSNRPSESDSVGYVPAAGGYPSYSSDPNSSSSASYRSSSDPESSSRSSSSSVTGPPAPVDPSTPPRRYRRSTDVIPASPEENYLEPPEIDPEFLALWYQENYFKVDAHDIAQIQLQELVAKYIQGYRADEVLPLETLISVLDAYIEEQNARLSEFNVDVGEPSSSGVPGSIPSGRKGAFFVIEQNKKQLRRANDEIHQLKEHIAHLDEELTNVINRQRDLPGPPTSAPIQMDENVLQLSVESKRVAIERLTEEHDGLQAQLDELNTFVREAREYVQVQEVEVQRLKEEIIGIHDYTDQLRQQMEGVDSSTSRSYSIPFLLSDRDPRLGRTFDQPPLNRTFTAPPQPALAAAGPVGQNQMPQSPMHQQPNRHSYPQRSRPNKIRNDEIFGRSIGRLSNRYNIGRGFNMSASVTGSPRNLTQHTTMDSLAPSAGASRMSDAPMKLNTTVKISPRSTDRSRRIRSGDTNGTF